jgi:hypothetical protein
MKNNRNQAWTLADSNYAWDEHNLGRSHKYIARRLGRSEKAVEINISKTRIRTKTAPFKLDEVGPAVTKSYADKLVKKNRVKPKKVDAKKAVVAPAESVLVNGGLMLTLSVSLAGGILGAAFYHYFL